MSDSRSCGRCIYYNSITNECGEESKCMKDVDEAKYTSYIEGKKQGREDAFQEIAYSDSVIKEPFETLAYEKGKLDGAREFAEWLCSEKCGYINGNNHFTTGIEDKSIDEVLAEWQKGAENAKDI